MGDARELAALLAHEAMENGEQKRCRLAAARHRAGQEVAALERRRNRLLLDGRRAREAQLPGASEQVGVQLESGERHLTGTRTKGDHNADA